MHKITSVLKKFVEMDQTNFRKQKVKATHWQPWQPQQKIPKKKLDLPSPGYTNQISQILFQYAALHMLK